jgi:hypothetical protein
MVRAIFFQSHREGKRVRIFTEEKIKEITELHKEGKSRDEICKYTGIKSNTYSKAVCQHRLVLPTIIKTETALSTKSTRNREDDAIAMGKSCTNVYERIFASRFGESVSPRFGNHLDLNHGGILLTLPSLIASGLLSHIERFSEIKGYYSVEQVFICLAFLVLLRVKKLERSQEIPSGELGRCMGLDRIPEVKTLRERISSFCETTDVKEWMSELSTQWMQGVEEIEGVLYIDGHVDLYYHRFSCINSALNIISDCNS